MSGIWGCGSPFLYEKYVSKDPLLNVTMDKIAGWTARETRGAGSSYAQVSFLAPDAIKEAVISLTVKDAAHLGTKDDLEAAAADILARREKFSGFKLDKRAQGFWLGQPAVVLDMTYMAILSMSHNVPLVAAHEKLLIGRVKGNFYFFRYQNAAGAFAQFAGAFDHMIKSARSKD